jgi:putative DNA primase/helicase
MNQQNSDAGKAAVRAQFDQAEEIPPLENELGGGGEHSGGYSSKIVELPVGAIEVTEDGVARGFVDRYGDRVRFDHVASKWFLWVGDHWKRDDTQQAFQWSRELARHASGDSVGSELKNARKASFAGGVERLARSDQKVAVTSEQWDPDPMVLGCPGGMVDLNTGKLVPADPARHVTKRVAIAPEPGPCPRWIEFLMEATGGDEDAVHFLQVWFGYLLTGLTTEHVLLFLYGPGGNGKSLFLNIIKRVMGDYAKTAGMDTFTASSGERHPTDLADLHGARLVSASETEEGRSWAESRIKSITGGDPVTARFMRSDFFTYLPTYKLMIVGNHQPVLKNVDEAIRRRFLILPFTRKPSRPDPDLEGRIWQEEAPQIFAWAIRGCLEWQQEGLPRPKSIASATDQYFEDQDLFGAWLADSCDLGDRTDGETPAQLFGSWKLFCEAAGERPSTQKALGNRLRMRGLSNGLERNGGAVRRVWFGIKLKGGSYQPSQH